MDYPTPENRMDLRQLTAFLDRIEPELIELRLIKQEREVAENVRCFFEDWKTVTNMSTLERANLIKDKHGPANLRCFLVK